MTIICFPRGSAATAGAHFSSLKLTNNHMDKNLPPQPPAIHLQALTGSNTTVSVLPLLQRCHQALSSTLAPSVQPLATLFIHVKRRGGRKKKTNLKRLLDWNFIFYSWPLIWGQVSSCGLSTWSGGCGGQRSELSMPAGQGMIDVGTQRGWVPSSPSWAQTSLRAPRRHRRRRAEPRDGLCSPEPHRHPSKHTNLSSAKVSINSPGQPADANQLWQPQPLTKKKKKEKLPIRLRSSILLNPHSHFFSLFICCPRIPHSSSLHLRCLPCHRLTLRRLLLCFYWLAATFFCCSDPIKAELPARAPSKMLTGIAFMRWFHVN